MNAKRFVFVSVVPAIAVFNFVLVLGFAGIRLNIASNSLPPGFYRIVQQGTEVIFLSALPESLKKSQSKESTGKELRMRRRIRPRCSSQSLHEREIPSP